MLHLDACLECWRLFIDLTRSADSSARPFTAIVPLLTVGDVVDRYIIRDVVGAGAMGVVYRAFDPKLSREVALKLLHPRHTDAPGVELLEEARVLARLAHPNVVAIHDVGIHADQVFLAMDLGRETLRSRCKPSSEAQRRETLKLVLQAGEGLAAAHATGLVHRDVKPENILIGADGRALMTDFGLARADGPVSTVLDGGTLDEPSLTVTGMLVGTPAYMAPEQLNGGTADERSDQFSFCATLFEALSGERPFRAATLPELREALSSGRIRRDVARLLPRWLRRVVLRGLRRDPEARWPSMRALLDEIGRGPPLSRTRVIVAATGAAGVFLVLTALVWGVVTTSRQRARAERRFNDVRKLALSFLFEFHAAIRDLPGSTKARELLAKRASEQFDSLAAEAAGDSDLERDLATAYETLSTIQDSPNSSLGDHAGSAASLVKALAIRERLAAAAPNDLRAQRELAFALNRRGESHNNEPAGLAELRRALGIWEQLMARVPEQLEVQRGLARCNFALALALKFRGDYRGALEAQQRAGAIYERIAANHPNEPDRQRDVVVNNKYVGGLFEQLGELDRAREVYERTVALDEARAAAQPNNAQAKLDLSYSYASLAYNRKRAKQFDQSLALYRKGQALREAVAAADSANLTAQKAVARGLASIADALLESGAAGEARKTTLEALSRFETIARQHSDDLSLPSQVARQQAKVGDEERALAATGGVANLRAAHEWYQKGIAGWRLLKARGLLDANDQRALDETIALDAECARSLGL
jgi:tetratricopeptide (TPR) repeat protein